MSFLLSLMMLMGRVEGVGWLVGWLVGSFGDMSSFVGRFHRGFGSLGDMSSFVGSSILGLFFLV
jgi:hypothetical protein